MPPIGRCFALNIETTAELMGSEVMCIVVGFIEFRNV